MKFNFLLPKQTDFYDLLNKLAKYVKDISLIYREFVAEEINWQEKKEEFSQKAKEIEHQADEITHEIVDRLNRTFVTPLDREDIYLLAHELDDIVDKIENVINNINIYKVKEKEKFFEEFSEIFEKAGISLTTLIGALPKQKYAPEIRNLIIQIHDLEDEGDLIFARSVSSLFENSADPVSVVKLKDIAEDLEKIADKFQEVSNTVEGVLVKSQ